MRRRLAILALMLVSCASPSRGPVPISPTRDSLAVCPDSLRIVRGAGCQLVRDTTAVTP